MANQHTKITDDQILQKGTYFKRRSLLPAMLRAGVEEKCAKCSLGKEWQGIELVLQIDHEDGDKTNNELSNLRFLCPNCHSQCETSFNRATRKVQYNFLCFDCQAPVNSKAKRCKKCAAIARANRTMPKSEPTYIYPPVEEIIRIIQETGSWLAASRIIGIEANTLRKHVRSKGLDPKEIKYTKKLLGDK